MNRIELIGRLGRDAELALTKNGANVLKFSLAVSRKVGDKFETDWFNVVTYGERARKWKEQATRGAEAMVIGEMTFRQYQGRDGQQKTWAEVNAHTVRFMVSPRREEHFQSDQGFAPQQASQEQLQPAFTEEDLPF